MTGLPHAPKLKRTESSSSVPSRGPRTTSPPKVTKVTLKEHGTAPLACAISISDVPPVDMSLPPFSAMSLHSQENAVIDDLLHIMMGFQGRYISQALVEDAGTEFERLSGPKFHIASGLDSSLREVAVAQLVMATHYASIKAFIEIQSGSEYGMVNHALCAAMRELLKDYLILIAQLEHQFLTNTSFTLQALHLHSRSTAQYLFHLYQLVQDFQKRNTAEPDDNYDNMDEILEQLRAGADFNAALTGGSHKQRMVNGGASLGLLTSRLESLAGDPVARKLLQHLLKLASVPYTKMLNQWIHHGQINDPFGEFLIREQKSIKKEKLEEDYTSEYWERRYTIRKNDLPPQLVALKDKVLLAGKYLNVVRECGGVHVTMSADQNYPVSFDDPSFRHNIQTAYAFANSSLLTLLLTTHSLKHRLYSLKHYFFLNQSDFMSHFLELSAHELSKPHKSVSMQKLQSLLDISIRAPGSIAANDPFKEDIKVQMSDVGLIDLLFQINSVSGLGEEALTTGKWTESKEKETEHKAISGRVAALRTGG